MDICGVTELQWCNYPKLQMHTIVPQFSNIITKNSESISSEFDNCDIGKFVLYERLAI